MRLFIFEISIQVFRTFHVALFEPKVEYVNLHRRELFSVLKFLIVTCQQFHFEISP